jgi:DNA-binding response OmpR family regulator
MPKIAIIEDDQPLAEMYKQKLEAAGMEVLLAMDGKTGLDLLLKEPIDLLLLDLMLPQMTGSQILEEYRKTPIGKDTKVIVLTNISEYEAPEELYKLGILRYMVKANYTPSQVVVVVEEALEL